MLRRTREAENAVAPLLDVTKTYTDIVTTVFSSTIAFKAWFATAAVVFACIQVLTASRMWGKLQRVVPLSFEATKRVHRWSGRLAILCTLPVFFHCVFILGFQTPDARVAIHSIAGTFVYAIFVTKMLVISDNKRAPTREQRYPEWVLPVAGGALAATLLVLWLTSSLWFFTNVRFGF
jgi:uncharacterized protein DUF6529